MDPDKCVVAGLATAVSDESTGAEVKVTGCDACDVVLELISALSGRLSGSLENGPGQKYVDAPFGASSGCWSTPVKGEETDRVGSFFSLLLDARDRLRPIRAPTDILRPFIDQPEVSLTGEPFSLLLSAELDRLCVSTGGTFSRARSGDAGADGLVAADCASRLLVGNARDDTVDAIGARAAAVSSSFMASPRPATEGLACMDGSNGGPPF